jgi:hypothetical protein
MKHLAILPLSAIIVLVGCANGSAPEPTPGNPTVSAPAEKKIAQLGALPGDVGASAIFARNALTVPKDLVQASQPIDPKQKIADEGTIEWVKTTDALKIVEMGNATSELPIDDTTGESNLFIAVQAEGAAVDEALAGLEVYDPDGVRINKRALKPGIAEKDQPPMSTISLTGHKPGVYKIKHSAKAQRFGIALDARSPNSKLVMKLKPSTLQHLLGNKTTVDVALEDDGKPVTGAVITSRLVDPELKNGPRAQFTEVSPGVYRTEVSSLLTESDKTGAWLVDVRAEGKTASGMPFLRHARTGFHFGIPTAQLTGMSPVRIVNDAAGNAVAFETDVTLESKSLDRLEISGTLAAVGADGAEHPVALAFTGAGWDAGTHKVTLRFDAGYVKLTHLEGPYVVRNLKVFSLGTNALFQRVGSGFNTVVNAPRLDQMAMPVMTPALEHMVTEGILFAK